MVAPMPLTQSPGFLASRQPMGQVAGWLNGPVGQFASNTLTDLGAGLLQGKNWQQGLQAAAGQSQQMAPMRQQEQMRQEAIAKEQQQQNATIQYLQDKGHDDLLQAVQSGGLGIGDAWMEAIKREQPAPPPDPFTLGEGDTRFDGMGNPIAQGAPQTPDTIINNGGTDSFYDNLDKGLATQQVDVMNRGMTARSNNMRLGQLEQHLAVAPQGAEGAWTQMVGSMGIPTQGLDDVQAAQALINQMVPGQRPPGSGTMSDADLALFKQSLPAIINQPGGNDYIIQTIKAINDYDIAIAEIATKVANRQMSPAEGRAAQAQVPNPLTELKQAVGGGGGAGAPAAPTGVDPALWSVMTPEERALWQ